MIGVAHHIGGNIMTGRKSAIARGRQLHRAAAIALALLAASAVPTTPLFAQPAAATEAPAQPIELGQPRSGVFPATSPDSGTIPHHDYRLRLEQGQSVRIRMDSPDPAAPPVGDATIGVGFDTYLELRLEGEQDEITSDDDSGEGLNSRIAFNAPSAGNYVIRARPLGPLGADENRTYRLLVEALPPPPPPGRFSGNRVEGDLGQGSPEDESYEPVRYAAYWFEGRAGERIMFEMAANSQGPSVAILDAAGTVLNSNIAYDSDRVRVIGVLPETGRYLVRAQVPSTATAHYTLELTRATVAAARTVSRIAIGETVPGRFTLESQASPTPDGTGQFEFFYQLFAVDVREGETVTAIVDTEGFEPLLEAGTTSVLGFVPGLTAMNTEMGNARLVINPFQSGTVVLRLRTPTLEVGSFRLQVVPGLPQSQ